jgi:hypothetical protein
MSGYLAEEEARSFCSALHFIVVFVGKDACVADAAAWPKIAVN